jgi:UPF0716 protein FxsA
MIFLLLFILIPIIEIALFIEVGGEIGMGWTLLLCVFTAILGVTLIRIQGVGTLLSARNRMEHNEMPIKEMFDGLCLAFAGAVLITPGFFTDAIGFSLLIPPVRALMQQYIISRFDTRIFGSEGQTRFHHRAGRQSPFRSKSDSIIDGEYERVDDEPEQINDKS